MDCSYFDAGVCRSCTLMGVPYAEQLDGKDRLARELLAPYGDATWLAPPQRCALGDGDLGGADAVDRDGSAVHPPERTGLLERVQVAAHGLGRDPESLGEVDDGDAAVVEQHPLDQPLALHCVHAVSLRWFPTRYNTFTEKTTCRCGFLLPSSGGP